MKRGRLLIGALALSTVAQAHVRQRYYYQTKDDATEGQESILGWPTTGSIKIEMYGFAGTVGKTGTTTATSIDFTTARALAGSALSQWKGSLFAGLSPSFTLDLDGGLPHTTTSRCELTTTGDVDGHNNLLFTSMIDTSCTASLTEGTGVIGLTKVQFRPTDGTIVEADMQFDDVEFLFKTSGTNNLASTPKQIVLKDVLVHEMGHFFGLDHSSARNSTMLFSIAENLQTTKTDDQMGVFSLYTPAGAAGALGGAVGSLTLSDKSPVFGAVVFALNPRTLTLNASEMTDLNGAFEFCALPAGPQIFFANAYRPFGPNITSYYSGDTSGSAVKDADGKCYNPGCITMTESLALSWYSKTPSAGSGGTALRVANVPAGGKAQFVNIAGSNSETALTDTPDGDPLALDEPRVARLSTGTIPIGGTGSNVGTHAYAFTAPASGAVQIRTAALSIYSRLALSVQLMDSSGATDLSAARCPVSAGHGAAVDTSLGTDPWLDCTGLTPGAVYRVRLTGTGVACAAVPGNAVNCSSSTGERASTPIPYYILSVYETSRLADLTLAEALDGASSAGSTYRNLPSCGAKSLTTTGTPQDGGGCCGTLGGVPGGPDGPTSGLLAVLLSPVLWFALWWQGRRVLRFRAGR